MLKLNFILIILLLLSLNLTLFGQQKFTRFVEYEKNISNHWVNALSVGALAGSNSGWKIEFLTGRYKFLNLGMLSIFANQLKSNRSVANVYLLPLGISYPLKTGEKYTIRLNSNFYIFPANGSNEKDNIVNNYPRYYEFSLRYDRSFLSLSAGYRFQNGEWTTNGIKNPDTFKGVFFQIDLGISWLDIKQKFVKKKTKLSKKEYERAEQNFRLAMGPKVFLKVDDDAAGSAEELLIKNYDINIREILKKNGFVLVNKRNQADGIIKVYIKYFGEVYLGSESEPVGPYRQSILKYYYTYVTSWRIIWKSAKTGEIISNKSYSIEQAYKSGGKKSLLYLVHSLEELKPLK